MTLRTRLTMAAAVAVAVAVVAVAFFAFRATRNVLVDEIDDSLVSRATDVAEATEAFQERADRRPGFGPPGEFIVPLPPFGGAGGFSQVVTADGEAVPANDQVGELPVSEHAVAVASGDSDAFFATTDIDGEQVRVYTSPLADGLALQVARPLGEVDSVLADLRWLLLLIAVGGIVLAAGIGFVVARTVLRPVDRLTEVAEEIAVTRDLTRRIDVDSRDELGRLAASFNTMLEALDDSMGAQRRLVADASHELRTPLTSLRTNIAVLTREEELDSNDAAQLRSEVDAQIAELSTLVGSVIDLARGDEPVHRREVVRLDEVVDTAVDQAAFHWPKVDFVTDLAPSAVTGDPDLIARAVTNLLDNAGKWSPDGSAVEVRVESGEVTVSDHGPGVAEADREHVFERFWRAPAARNKPGSGLGLAIVAQVAESHGGDVSVEDANGGGACFRFRLEGDSPDN